MTIGVHAAGPIDGAVAIQVLRTITERIGKCAGLGETTIALAPHHSHSKSAARNEVIELAVAIVIHIFLDNKAAGAG